MPPARNPDLHGNAPDRSETAVLLIDVINDMEYPEGEAMLPAALAMADVLGALCRAAREAKIPVVYVNDNFGRWQSDFRKTIDHVIGDDTRGRPVAEKLIPEEKDYFVLKPKNSGFYSTTLDTLLSYLGTKNVLLGGIATNSCVLFTAHDAYLRDYRLYVPRDCSTGHSAEEHEHALGLIEKTLKANTAPWEDLDLRKLGSSS